MLIIFLCPSCQHRQEVILALLGDISLGREVHPLPDSFSYLTPSLAGADLGLANLESPLGMRTGEESTGYNLCAPTEHAGLLAGWGFDLLSIANNHAEDCTPGGAEFTRSTLAASGLTGLSSKPVRMRVNGLDLVFFAFDDVSTELDAETAVEAVRLAHADGALVVVSMHWGTEYQGAPSSRQEELAERFAGAGAALVWGHHPHVLQPARWIETSRGWTLVLFSLGNALFDQGGLEDTRSSALVLVTLTADGITDVQAIPFAIDVPLSRILPPDAELAQKIHDRLGIP